MNILPSMDYLNELRSLHETSEWGATSDIPPFLKQAIRKTAPASILDFGCGKGNMTRALRARYRKAEISAYDPATLNVPLPEEVDLVFSTDVLEHVEPDALDATLLDLARRSKYMVHIIACFRARAMLRDGRNTHLIVQTPDWWQRKFRDLGFRILDEDVRARIAGKNPPQAEVHYACLVDRGV